MSPLDLLTRNLGLVGLIGYVEQRTSRLPFVEQYFWLILHLKSLIDNQFDSEMKRVEKRLQPEKTWITFFGNVSQYF